MGVRIGYLLVATAVLIGCSAGDDADPATDTTTIATATDEGVNTATTTVATNDTTTVVTTTTAPPSTLAGRSAEDFAAIAPVVEEFIAERGLNGAGLVLVTADQGIVYEQYWGVFDSERISLVASSTKMVTAGVLMYLHEQGLLDIDTPIAQTMADDPRWSSAPADITPAQLISNSSGLVGLLPDVAYAPYLCQFLPTGTLQDCALAILTTSEDDADVIAPDTEFRYGGGQWQVAGGLAEAVSGRSWEALIDEVYREPCGIDDFGYNNHFAQLGAVDFNYPTGFDGDLSVLAATDNPNMEGGLYTTVRDYAEVVLMHLRGGRCGDTEVLSPASIERLHADRTGEVYASPTGYAMGWWVDRSTGRLTDSGAYGSVAWIDPARGYGGFLVIEADSRTGGELAGQLYAVVDPIIDATAP